MYDVCLHDDLQISIDHNHILIEGPAQKVWGPSPEFPKNGPLRALSKLSHLPHRRRPDNSHILRSHRNLPNAINDHFCAADQYLNVNSLTNPFVVVWEDAFLTPPQKRFLFILLTA
jgi:hypothetical protein